MQVGPGNSLSPYRSDAAQERQPYSDNAGASRDTGLAGLMTPDDVYQIAPRGDDEVHEATDRQESKNGSRSKEGLTFLEFNRMVEEIQWQPDWRAQADKEADYYDNNQLDQETLNEMERRGILPVVKNLIQPTIDVVLGMEAKSRQDWRVVGDTDKFQDAAEGLSAKLHEAERESRADRACADGYAHQVKVGLGWAEVSRHWDPFEYDYYAGSVHRREIFWDWPSREPNLTDARYLIRRRWFDLDQVCAFFPDKKEELWAMGNGWPADWYLRRSTEDTELGWAPDQELRTSMEEWEWRNVIERRICLFEVWYRRYVRGYVIEMPDGHRVELDMNNPIHVVMLARGQAKPREAVYSKMRRSLWAGPHRLRDHEHQSRRLPYVPFWGYREDLTGIPYGLIRSMISPQDEINARAQKMFWMLSAKRVTMTADALDPEYNTVEEMLEEIGRADALVVLNEEFRKDRTVFDVDENLALADAQFNVMQDNKMDLQKVRGIFNAMMGSDEGADSGVAINSLIEQSTTVLAEINDNYQFSRKMVGELLLEEVRRDLSGQPVEVLVEDTGARRKTIILNERVQDPQTGATYIKNDVSKTRFKVGLQDVPSTPAYRSQTLVMLSEVMKGLPPELQSILVPFYLESTELPKRREMADLVRKHMGIVNEEDMSPEEQEAYQAAQDVAQKMQERAALAEIEKAEGEAERVKAAADKSLADVEKIRADIEQMRNQDLQSGIGEATQQYVQQIDQLNQSLVEMQAQLKDRGDEIRMKADTERYKADASKEATIAAAQEAAKAQQEGARVADMVNQAVGKAMQRIDQVSAEVKKVAQDARSQTQEAVVKLREQQAAERHDPAMAPPPKDDGIKGLQGLRYAITGEETPDMVAEREQREAMLAGQEALSEAVTEMGNAVAQVERAVALLSTKRETVVEVDGEVYRAVTEPKPDGSRETSVEVDGETIKATSKPKGGKE